MRTFNSTPTMVQVLLDGVHLMNGKKLADYHADLASIVSVKRRKAASCIVLLLVGRE